MNHLIELDVTVPVWEQFYRVSPLIVIGTKGESAYDFAPKHLAMPIGWDNFFGFVCTPTHQTYKNICSRNYFTVSYIKANQIVLGSLAASPKCNANSEIKPIIDHIPSFHASGIDALFIKDAYIFLECSLYKIIDGFGRNCIITGTVEKAFADPSACISSDSDETQLHRDNPLPVYVDPGRFATIHNSNAFPFPKDFRK